MTQGRQGHKEVLKKIISRTRGKQKKPDPEGGDEGPEGSDAQTQGPQGSDKRGRTSKTRGGRKNKKTLMEGNAKAEAMETKGRRTLVEKE